MQELEKTVANNISDLRKSQKWTQAELAEKLNYSDKSVSKWERGDALPDLKVLANMADLFGVTVDFFLHENAFSEKDAYSAPKRVKNSRFAIAMLVVALVFLVATVIYVYLAVYLKKNMWVLFVWAVPVSALLLSYLDRKWMHLRYSLYTGSIFCWSLLAAVYLHFLSYQLWMIFLIGIPVQIVLLLWDQISRNR